MPVYHVKCKEEVYFTVKIEAESEKEAEDLALDDINYNIIKLFCVISQLTHIESKVA